MWLIDTTTYKLKYFLVPPQVTQVKDDDESGTSIYEGEYAILSHTWDDEEVTFDDMQNLEAARMKQGFKKIELTCKQALEDDFQYVWVDTCCIDKRSSAELSEAINSMFKWYQEATVCYVFLSDFDAGETGIEIAGDSRDQTLRARILAFSPTPLSRRLRASRWFARGWTLQELIAPSHVIFFDRLWTRFGTKDSMLHMLSALTGIEYQVLEHGGNLRHTSAYQRMCWASNRYTTREEDQAYSMLGIFDVNMPLLYGEGSKASARLQEEIIRQATDHTIFVWSPQ
ncbi:hypothetical protein DOTSEDRAFT_145060, partial [Dothistroma septosporum NZE10]